ncbi:helix-turn-helix domain-containing protein [Miniimonas sp. S16]|uniref:helix-turn-helix domain-containing protein n=1 Tax=Miniimonas sp. S16 TaxID=2171623 RepID=UPI00131F3098|nr:helix-turn-helix transcriptional regulator [Miniimonas sp. S16]
MVNKRRDPGEDVLLEGFAEHLGRRLEAIRLDRGLSRAALSRASGVSDGVIEKIESRDSTSDSAYSPQVRQLVKLAGALGVPLSLLIPYSDQPPPPDPGASVDLAWPLDQAFYTAVRAHPMPGTTELARRRT